MWSYLWHSQSAWWGQHCLRPFAASDLHDPAGIAPPGTGRTLGPPRGPTEPPSRSCSEWVWRDEAAPAGLRAPESLGSSAGRCDRAPPGRSRRKNRVRCTAKWLCRRKKGRMRLRWCYTWAPPRLPLWQSAAARLYLNEGRWLEDESGQRKERTHSQLRT